MGLLSRFEGKMEDTLEGGVEKMGGSTLSPVQITKKAEKAMRREKIVGAGKQYAPTLFTVLVSEADDTRLFNYYPTLAGEVETYLQARAQELGLAMDGHPLVRFIADPALKHGKFDVVAELVASSIVSKLRHDEMVRYGLEKPDPANSPRSHAPAAAPRPQGIPPMGASRAKAEPYLGDYGAVGGVSGVISPKRSLRQGPVNSISSDFPDLDEPMPQRAATHGDQAASARAASPDAAIEGPMEVYLYDEASDVAYQLTGTPELIGRESANDVAIPDINISRVHAEISFDPAADTWWIRDMNSTNGLYVNGHKVDKIALQDADMITVGTTTLEFQDLR